MEEMEPAPLPTIPQPAPPAPQPPIATPPVKHSKFPILIGATAILVVGTAIGFISFQLFNQSPTLPRTNQSVPPPNPSPSGASAEQNDLGPDSNKASATANWKTYVSPNNYSIAYPQHWTLASSDATQWQQEAGSPKFTLTSGAYAITFSFPTGFGPGSCIFSDQPDFARRSPDTLDMGESLCAGEFVEVKGDMYVFRRLSKPTPPPREGGPNTWSIYTKDRTGKFVTIPPITYEAPLSYDGAIVKEMDQILSTFKFTN